jgi:hypothetical protein
VKYRPLGPDLTLNCTLQDEAGATLTVLNSAVGGGNSVERRTWLSIAVSSVAMALAIIHVLLPNLTVDAITLGLIAIAVAPWLAPIFKSIELPGGWKVEFQEFKRRVEQELERETDRVGQLAERLGRVEQFVLSGAVTPGLERQLSKVLTDFRLFLRQIGMELPANVPSVHLSTDEHDTAHYEDADNRIVVNAKFVDDPHVVTHVYAHHVLMHKLGVSASIPHASVDHLEAGIADYLAASFVGDPRVGVTVAEKRGRTEAYMRNLDNTLTLSELKGRQDPHKAGEIWGGILWELRTVLGKRTADTLTCAAWSLLAESCVGLRLSREQTADMFLNRLDQVAKEALEAPFLVEYRGVLARRDAG